ncbi:MAG: hypothetical protein Q8Q01_02550 [archaeon]|nr:hypothetical protein [archaeon]
MEEYLLEAKEELKRLEHIIYVSLKYTRTVDVIINALNRMVGTFDSIVEAFMKKAEIDGTIESMPRSPALKAKKLRELYPEDPILQKYLTFYDFLKKVLKHPYQKRQEYRRHVNLIADFENSTAEMNIDNLVNCEKFVHQFLKFSQERILGKKDDDDS